MEEKGRDVEEALGNYSGDGEATRRGLERIIERCEKEMYSKIKDVEPGENSAGVSKSEVLAVNPPRQEDPVRNLDRVDQLAALSAAYYSGNTGRELQNFFSSRGDLLRAAEYFLREDWEETFEGRGGYSVTQDLIFLKKLPGGDISLKDFPAVALPLGHLLLEGNGGRTLEGLLAHELTHAFIHRKTGYEKLSGKELSHARSVDEAAAHVAEGLYNDALPPTQSYQAKGLSKEYLHTAIEILQREKKEGKKNSIASIREKAMEMIREIEENGELSEQGEGTERYRKAVKIFEDVEKKTFTVLNLYGVIGTEKYDLGDVRAESFTEIMDEFDQELEMSQFDHTNNLVGTEESEDKQVLEMLETLREGLLDLAEHARDEEKKGIVPLAEKIEELLKYIHEEEKTLGEELHNFYFTRGKTSPQWLKGDTSKERRKDLKDILQKFREEILEKALEIHEELQGMTEKIFEHEKKLTELERKLEDKKEYEETVELIKFTKDIRNVNREAGQRLKEAIKEIEEAEDQLTDGSGMIIA